MKGVLLAISTIIVWAILNVVNRYCVLKYDTNVIVFTSFMIFATGVALMIVRKRVTIQKWKSGVGYSWLYTMMQVIRSFTIISTFLYISSTETSLLFNIEIIITYILTYVIFKRIPYKGDYWGIGVILVGFILFIFTLPQHVRSMVSILVIVSATASCVRSIVVEKTTMLKPDTTVRQKCGISGYTMFYGGIVLVVFFFLTAIAKFFMTKDIPHFLSFLKLLPDLNEMTNPVTIISACIAGFFINATTTYLYYATLRMSTSETFMTVRAFQPIVTYIFELLAAIFYTSMRPQLDTKDYILGAVIIVGSLLILIIPRTGAYTHQSRTFITD